MKRKKCTYKINDGSRALYVLETLKNARKLAANSFHLMCLPKSEKIYPRSRQNEYFFPPEKSVFPKVPFTKIDVTSDPLGVERPDWTKLKLQSPRTTLAY